MRDGFRALGTRPRADPQPAARAVKDDGVGLFIDKPLDLDYLIQVVRSFLDEHPIPAQ